MADMVQSFNSMLFRHANTLCGSTCYQITCGVVYNSAVPLLLEKDAFCDYLFISMHGACFKLEFAWCRPDTLRQFHFNNSYHMKFFFSNNCASQLAIKAYRHSKWNNLHAFNNAFKLLSVCISDICDEPIVFDSLCSSTLDSHAPALASTTIYDVFICINHCKFNKLEWQSDRHMFDVLSFVSNEDIIHGVVAGSLYELCHQYLFSQSFWQHERRESGFTDSKIVLEKYQRDACCLVCTSRYVKQKITARSDVKTGPPPQQFMLNQVLECVKALLRKLWLLPIGGQSISKSALQTKLSPLLLTQIGHGCLEKDLLT